MITEIDENNDGEIQFDGVDVWVVVVVVVVVAVVVVVVVPVL